MKACAACQRLFGDGDGFCPIDGKPLLPSVDVVVPPDPDDPRIGAVICGGRYEVRRKVADGGMGRVYQAIDHREHRGVALKILHADVATDPIAVERFKREFSFSAKLPHDHIVEVLDFLETEDESYALVMEYLEGEELRVQLKREKTISAARVVQMLSQLAIGLGEAHAHKIVHRDIKPDNIFVCDTPEGTRIKLLDFGSVRDNSEGAKKLTIIGTTIGSPYYMSPEQAQGLADLDHRADVWSLAAIAYECLTGKVPFGGSTGPAILLAILGREPDPPSTVAQAQHVPESVDDVMVDALAKDPQARVASLAELADRFGRAYGLTGEHREWAYLREPELAARIEAGKQHLPVPRSRQPVPVVKADDADSGSAFRDDEFVMGVPTGSRSTGLVVAIAAVVLLGVLAVVLVVTLG
ncbi:MAG: serine/threonine protein kinase [Polyangiaceae bacterium]|nr:serine/threonine protein kinase [Polyangiaceae bacterium]